MAEPSHLDIILKEGVRAWNEWRAENPSTLPDLVNANLEGADLQGANLERADLRESYLRGADLRRANLHEANLRRDRDETNVWYENGADLYLANLAEANLAEVDLQGAYLEGAILEKARFTGANLLGAVLRRANLTEANLIVANLAGADLTGADLTGAELKEANLAGANLTGADLTGVDELTENQIEQAVGDETTTLPEHLDLPVGWRSRTNERSRARAGNLRGAANDTVAAEDQLGFADYVDAFAQLIAAPDTHPPLTIGIYGSWGMGKSFLLHHIEQQLKSKPGDENSGSSSRLPSPASGPDVHVVHFNAWEYSAAEVIWPGLVRTILNKLEETWSPWQRFAKRFGRNIRRQTRQFRGRLILVALVLVVVLLVALLQSKSDATIVGSVGGAIAVLGIGGLAKLITDTLANPLGQYVTALAEDSDYGRHIGYMTEIREDLEGLEKRLRGNNGRILVVIDDLDRCEPKKAVEVLQAINLLLNFESFIVCLGIDARIITAAVEKHYEDLLGEVGASGHEYLEKIVQIPFHIPQPGEEEIRNFISKQMGDPKPSSEEVVPEDSSGEQQLQRGRSLNSQESKPGKGTDGESLPPPPPPPEPVAFTHDELKAFEDVASFLRPNPRHLKRLVNVYRLVRSLAAAKAERAILDKPAATIRWLVICAQWPYTSQEMLRQFGEMLEEQDGRIPAGGDPLLYLFDQASLHLSKEKQRELDDDPKALRKLLGRNGERLTWEELRRIRQYTVNFNPEGEAKMWALTEAEQPVESPGAEPSDMETSQAQAKETPT
jgi:uncharacterized protein YjbI with pentapeptide repeats/Cdc6-like AAA superfamily ATPase